MRDRSDWMLNPRIFYKNTRRWGPLEVDLFASRLTTQLQRFFSWRPDPEAEALDAFNQDWSSIQGRGYANPPWNLVGRVLNRTQQLQVTGAGASSMEEPTMVSQSSGDVGRLPSPPSSKGRSDHTNTPNECASSIASASRLAYLRRCEDKKISGEGKDLLFASWRQKSSKSYDSLFAKWVGWCSQRHSDPVSGPISEVVNFLAHLFKEGYQYHSLNAYCSTISSVHEKVDGYEVGQHPLVSRVLKGAFN